MAYPKLTPAQQAQAKQAKATNQRNAQQRAARAAAMVASSGMNSRFGAGKAADDRVLSYGHMAPAGHSMQHTAPSPEPSNPLVRSVKGISGTLLNRPRQNR